jgi:tetratricopeptide (TPR) repeat protein
MTFEGVNAAIMGRMREWMTKQASEKQEEGVAKRALDDLSYRYALARLKIEGGDYTEAIASLRDILARLAGMDGDANLTVWGLADRAKSALMHTRYRLAFAHRINKDSLEAEALLNELMRDVPALAGRVSVPSLENIENELALVYLDQFTSKPRADANRLLASSRSLFEKARAASKEKDPREESLSILPTLHNLALIDGLMENFDGAIAKLRHCVRVATDVHKRALHPNTLTSEFWLGRMHFSKRDYDRSLAHFGRALEGFKQIRQTPHPDISDCDKAISEVKEAAKSRGKRRHDDSASSPAASPDARPERFVEHATDQLGGAGASAVDPAAPAGKR